MEPRANFDCVGGAHNKQDAHLQPARFVQALTEHVRSLGVTILENTEVLQLTRSERKITSLETGKHKVSADEVVIAAGSWFPTIVQNLGLKLPTQAAKGYSITQQCLNTTRRMPFSLAEINVVGAP